MGEPLMSNGGTLVVRNPASRTRATDGVPTLDDAWARAEAALPEDANLDLYIERNGDVRYVAEAGRGEPPFAEIGSGPNPAAALIALAEKLEAR